MLHSLSAGALANQQPVAALRAKATSTAAQRTLVSFALLLIR